jgi:hypothetical protein
MYKERRAETERAAAELQLETRSLRVRAQPGGPHSLGAEAGVVHRQVCRAGVDLQPVQRAALQPHRRAAALRGRADRCRPRGGGAAAVSRLAEDEGDGSRRVDGLARGGIEEGRDAVCAEGCGERRWGLVQLQAGVPVPKVEFAEHLGDGAQGEWVGVRWVCLRAKKETVGFT